MTLRDRRRRRSSAPVAVLDRVHAVMMTLMELPPPALEGLRDEFEGIRTVSRTSTANFDHGVLAFIRGSQISIGTGKLEGSPISLRDPEAGQTLHIHFLS